MAVALQMRGISLRKFTITSILNDKLKSDGIDLIIVNAGIEGQTTRGHLYNLLHWFPKNSKFQTKILYLLYRN